MGIFRRPLWPIRVAIENVAVATPATGISIADDTIAGHQRVIFSERAVAAIVAETHAMHPNETGGILLGHCIDGIWHVIEAIDPGPGSRFSPVTFEYDAAYVNHLARKVAGQYQRPLRLIGLWHRHPGSFDRFSAEDDLTNRRYAIQAPEGAISCLVNIDPHFRITAYHVPADLRYQRLSHQCSNHAIPADLMELRRRSCLEPEPLEEHRQQQLLRRLLSASAAMSSGPLPLPLADQIDRLLEQLEQQERFAYGLRVCGPVVMLALVEKHGPGQTRLEIHQSEQGEIRLRGGDGAIDQPFDGEWLQRLLRGSRHD